PMEKSSAVPALLPHYQAVSLCTGSDSFPVFLPACSLPPYPAFSKTQASEMQKEKEPKETLPMSSYSRISKAFQHPCRLPLYQDSRYVLFSDCHRGTGRSNDNFLKNEFLYVSALKYYEEQGYTYLELGDGDELWENRSFCAV